MTGRVSSSRSIREWTGIDRDSLVKRGERGTWFEDA